MKNKILLVGLFCCSLVSTEAQVLLDKNAGKNSFPIVSPAANVVVCFDGKDETVVRKSVTLFADDVRRVTGQDLKTQASNPGDVSARYAIIVGTVGKSAWINALVAQKKIDTTPITGGWERYMIETVDNPAPGIKKAIVVAGSDRRGTAYGLLSISKAIGVSPWYWWADAPIKQQKKLAVNVHKFISKEPAVKFRGIFINDEDWGLYRWSKNNYEKERGNFGPKTYAQICELLLRLQANYLCPAMHDASMAFHRIPENRLVADSFAIVMGSSHCEPLLFNTASEWKRDKMGEWDYINNRAGVDSVLRARANECAPFENVYTLALRGLHDRAMNASNDMADRKQMLQDALMAQRKMLIDATGKRGEDIPQAFTPYKEVLDVYNAGLELPDDVTIIWPDDNYGYMKRLSSLREQKRSGRAGVYYHVSYLGKPHDYLWMSTISPALMYEELRKAYDATADRVWLLNVGDIKSCEFSMNLFLSMAYDINAFGYHNISTCQARWLADMFGQEYYEDFRDITTTFYHQSFSRKPELMGWGYQWSTNKHGKERNTDTDFSFTNYREADTRLAEYDRIGTKVDSILQQLPESEKAGFYQLLYYPVKGCEYLNKMVLYGQKNRWYALQGRAATDSIAKEAKACYDSLQIITQGYNSLLNGKWNPVMTTRQGFAASYFELPKLLDVSLPAAASLGVLTEGEDVLRGKSSIRTLPAFNTYFRQSYYFDLFNKGLAPLEWNLEVSDDWIIVDRKEGVTKQEERIWVSVDWSRVPVGERVSGVIDVMAGNAGKDKIYVSVFNPSSPSLQELDTLFVEHNGYVSINAADYHRKVENEDIKIKLIPNLGFEDASVQLGNPIAPVQRTGNSTVPRVEYDFYAFGQGSVDVYTYVLPTFTLSTDKDYAGHEATNIETKYGVCIDDGPVMNPSTSSFEYAQIWYESVLKNCRINKTTLHINEPGKHTVKVLCGDPGTVLQKVVLDFGGMQRSYLGPRPTKTK